MHKTAASILVIDDNHGVLESARLLLKQHFTDVFIEDSPRELLKYFREQHIDVYLLDMNFRKGEDDGREGLYWLDYILKVDENATVILMTAFGEVSVAVKAIKKGANDFVLKPWSNEKLLATVHAGLKLSREKQKVNNLKATNNVLQSDMHKTFGRFISESAAMQNVFNVIEKVSGTDANILILGENGTGKELVAREIHRQSMRSKMPFVTVDLGALSETLFESELFGHERGAFTDAKEERAGRFELANDGTIFLDEIGNLPLALQSKMLSVLQQRKIMRLGSSRETAVNIRLISATNMPLYDMVDKNEFRQDLLYRINTIEIRLPALRERTADIPVLANHFLNVYARKYGKAVQHIPISILKQLERYPWPGNVRELQHAIERAVILSEGEEITSGDLQLTDKTIPQQPREKLNLEENERLLIEQALEKYNGNISKAANALGLTRPALYRRLEKYGVQ